MEQATERQSRRHALPGKGPKRRHKSQGRIVEIPDEGDNHGQNGLLRRRALRRGVLECTSSSL